MKAPVTTALARCFKVTGNDLPLSSPMLVYGQSGREGVFAMARAHLGLTRRADIEAFIRDKALGAVEMHPFMIPERRFMERFFFSESIETAVARRPNERIRASTHYDALQVVDRKVLVWQPFYLWNASEIRRRFKWLYDWHRDKRQRDWRDRKMSRGHVQAIAAHVHLATVDARLGPALTHGTRSYQARELDREVARTNHVTLHRGNVRESTVRAVFAAGANPKLEPYSPELRTALRAFTSEYGETDLSWSEITALWEGGPRGLEKARLEKAIWGGHVK